MSDQRQRSQWAGEAWGGAILLLTWGMHILRGRLQTHYNHKMPCRMRQIQRASARPNLPLISHHFKGRLQFMCQEYHASCKRTRVLASSDSHHLIKFASLGRSQLAGSLGEDAAWQSGKGTPHPPAQMARSYRTWRWLIEESPENQCHRRSWQRPYGLPILALGLTGTHPFDRKA